MKRHPVMYGIVIFSILGLIYFASTYIFTRMVQGGGSLSLSDKIGVVNIEGIIAESRLIVEDIDEFRQDDTIRAIVLRIDSPGGGVAASQEIYQAVLEARKRKKVVASLGSVAASGGYLVACATDQIVANPGTVTGSISAIINFPNVEELLKKLGISSSVVKSGKFKDIGSPVRVMTAEERHLMQQVVDDIFDQFLEVVMTRRNIPREELLKIADGRIFTGKYAHTAGLVDHLGDFGTAVRLAARLAEIKDEPTLVYARKRTLPWWDMLIASPTQAGALLKKVLHPIASYQYF